MSLVKIKKEYRGMAAGSQHLISDAVERKMLCDAGYAEEINDDAIGKIASEEIQKAMSGIGDVMKDVFETQAKAYKETVSKFSPTLPAVARSTDDEPERIQIVNFNPDMARQFRNKNYSRREFRTMAKIGHNLRGLACYTAQSRGVRQPEYIQKAFIEPWENSQNDLRKAEEEWMQKAVSGLNETQSSEGEFLTMEEFNATVLERMHQENALLQMTDHYNCGGKSMTIRANAETSRATGSRMGGVRGYRVPEGGSITSSMPTFREIKLEPKKYVALVYVTEELLEDAVISLPQYIMKCISSEFNFMIGDDLINGTGAGMPLGILNAGCTIAIAAEGGQNSGTILVENIDKMWARRFGPNTQNYIWLHNQDIEPQLAGLARAVGTGGELVYNPPGGVAGSPFATLKGRPLMPTEFNATLGTQGDLILADMSQMITASRGGIKSATSIHVRFLFDEMAFRFTMRFDAQPWWNTTLTPYKGGSNTQSPFLTIATR